MEDIRLKRLTSEQYMSLSSPFRMLKQEVDSTVSVHWHDFFEMEIVLSGSGTHVLNGTAKPLSRGMLFLLTPADFHEIIPAPGERIRVYNLIFTEQFIRPPVYELLFAENREYVFTFAEAACAALEAEYDRIWEESNLRRPGGELLIQGAFERIVIELVRKCGMNAGDDDDRKPESFRPVHPAVRKAVTFIRHHFREPLTLESVARHAGLSANYFSECFCKQMGEPFQQYVQQIRLQFARSLLLVSALPVTEICYISGFRTFSHFERTFKQSFGLPPNGYRKFVR